MSFVHTISDEDSDSTVDTSLTPTTQNKRKLSHSQSLHEISDSDSDSTIDTSNVAKHKSSTEKRVDNLAIAAHSVSNSDCDMIPDTDSEENKVIKKLPAKFQADSRKRHTEHAISSTESENENNTSPVKRLKKSVHKDHNKSKHNLKKQSNSHSQKNSKKEKPVSVFDVSTEEMSSDEDDPKPQCPYGLKCYRKNLSHLEDYSHPDKHSRLLPQKSKSTTTTASLTLSAVDKVRSVSPVNFLLTTVTGISSQHNNFASIGIRDILSSGFGTLRQSVQFNYCIDVDWIVAQYAPEFKKKPLLIVHGSQRSEKATLDLAASKYEHVKMCQARMEIPYGTHHTKMMMLLYEEGLRVVIHTANIVEKDWYQKTQGVWMSPLYPPMDKNNTGEDGDSPTFFKRDLLEYLSSYKARQLEEWINIIKRYDMSSTKVFLIASIPGRHTGSRKQVFGHLKLRKVLSQYGPAPVHMSGWPIIGQFSSVGSLGANKESWLCGEWRDSLATCRKDPTKLTGVISKPNLQLIFPTRDNVRCSLEGYPAGASVPYSINVAKKQPYLHSFFHQWRSDSRGRTRACPHIKTYARPSPDGLRAAWCVVTSCNLSKAAWGVLEKQGSQLMIRSYELGVLFVPQMFKKKSTYFHVANDDSSSSSMNDDIELLLPFDLPLTPYAKSDKPWIWDIPCVDKPDSHGNMWCPQ